ncbi:MAG: PIN domain-containing protein [Candidatus Coatesbacteria bacterium]
MNMNVLIRRIVIVVIAVAAAWLVGPDHRWIVPAVLLAGCVWMLVAEFGGFPGMPSGGAPANSKAGAVTGPGKNAIAPKLLDTSVIIDGRIAEVCETGFLEGVFYIPRFVLQELQRIADSSDPLKRNRGRRGLDILNRMQRSKITLEVLEVDAPETREVDEKLLIIGKARGARIITNDFNLNKVAEIHGVPVLNINDLANALKPAVLPGELLTIRVIKEGKEAGQGIGYLDDGTMVVVDNGKVYMGQKIEVVVTSALQTAAGRMIFAKKRDEAGEIITH